MAQRLAARPGIGLEAEMRRFLWLWIVLAFLLGLVPGVGLFLFTRTTYIENYRQVAARNAQLVEKNRKLELQLDSAEASASAFAAEAARQQTGSSADATGTGTAGEVPTGGPTTITAKSATPSPVARGAKLTLSMSVAGKAAERANIRIVGPGGFDKTYFLGKTGTQNGAEVWEKTIDAPRTPGAYRYYAIAYSGGQKVTMPQTANVTFAVK
jgi:cell division protein FtsB